MNGHVANNPRSRDLESSNRYEVVVRWFGRSHCAIVLDQLVWLRGLSPRMGVRHIDVLIGAREQHTAMRWSATVVVQLMLNAHLPGAARDTSTHKGSRWTDSDVPVSDLMRPVGALMQFGVRFPVATTD